MRTGCGLPRWAGVMVVSDADLAGIRANAEGLTAVYRTHRQHHSAARAAEVMAEGWAADPTATIEKLAGALAVAVWQLAEAHDEAAQSRQAIDTYVGALAVERAEVERLRPQISEARETLADYAAHAVDGHGIDPYTAAWIRDGLLEILGEDGGGS